MNTIKYIQSKNFDGIKDIAELRSDFYKKRITVSYDPECVDGKRRVIFSCSKTIKTQTFDDVCLECNGLILEAPEWKPLCIPIPSSKNNVNTTKLNGYLKNDLYNIYQIEDGTIINLYYYNNKWTISTSRGLDMNNVKFNSLTYGDLLKDCLSKKEISDQEFYDSLDKKKCYTFGFKHPDIHPFWEGKEEPVYKIWFVRSIDLDNLEVNDKPPLNKIGVQKKINIGVTNMNFIYKKLKTAYENFVEHKNVNYGYILADKNVNTLGDDSMIILESSLLNSIRNLWYNGSYIKFSQTHKFERINTILLNSFLDDTRTDKFLKLFPQYSKEFENLSDLEKSVVLKVYDDIKNDNKDPKSLHYPLINLVNNTITVSTHDNPCRKIKDIIHNNDNIHVYYNLIYNQPTNTC